MDLSSVLFIRLTAAAEVTAVVGCSMNIMSQRGEEMNSKDNASLW